MVDTQPKFSILFRELAVSAIKRNARGRVVLILNDDTAGFPDGQAFKLGDAIDKTKMTAENYELVLLTQLGSPLELVLVKAETTFALTQAKLLEFDNYYLVYPEIEPSDEIEVKNFIKARRIKNDYSQAIFGNAIAPDAEYIINLCTPASGTFDVNITGDVVEYTAEEYACRIAGALAGLPSSRSITYFELPELVKAPLYTDDDVPVSEGKLVVIKQDGTYKVGRGVNSLTTLTDGVTEAFQKIRIMSTIDMISNDFVTTFRTAYVGKYVNTYENKVRLCGAMNAYLMTLENEGLLQPRLTDKSGTYDPKDYQMRVSYDKNKLYLEGKGKDTSKMSYEEILRADTGSKVLLDGTVAPTDTMEDLDITVFMYQALETA